MALDTREIRPNLLTSREAAAVLGGALSALYRGDDESDLRLAMRWWLTHSPWQTPEAIRMASQPGSKHRGPSLLSKISEASRDHFKGSSARAIELSNQLGSVLWGLDRVTDRATLKESLSWWVDKIDHLRFDSARL